MKEIKMDFKTYLSERNELSNVSRIKALSDVAEFLESGLTLVEWRDTKTHILHHHNWDRIVAALKKLEEEGEASLLRALVDYLKSGKTFLDWYDEIAWKHFDIDRSSSSNWFSFLALIGREGEIPMGIRGSVVQNIKQRKTK